MSSDASFDRLPPRELCPPGWLYQDFATRAGARIAADYWDECGNASAADWLRLWADLAPSADESTKRRNRHVPASWSKNGKFAKQRRARIERAAARHNPDTAHGYGHRGIF